MQMTFKIPSTSPSTMVTRRMTKSIDTRTGPKAMTRTAVAGRMRNFAAFLAFVLKLAHFAFLDSRLAVFRSCLTTVGSTGSHYPLIVLAHRSAQVSELRWAT